MSFSLADSPLFRGIAPEALPGLLSCLGGQERPYEKGAVILLEGAPTDRLGVVLSGSVLIELNDVWGGSSVLDRIGPGGIFAEAYACVPDEPLLVTATAAEACRVLLVRIAQLSAPCSRACASHTQVIGNLLAISARKNLNLSRRMLHTAPKTIRRRLLSYFSECARRCASSQFDIPYDRQQLADYLGVERSALCKTLSAMQRQGLLSYRKNRFTLHIGDTERF